MAPRKLYPEKMKVLLTEEDKRLLLEAATKLSISEAEFIRQLIRRYVRDQSEE